MFNLWEYGLFGRVLKSYWGAEGWEGAIRLLLMRLFWKTG